MRYLSFSEGNRHSYGYVVNDGVVDLGKRTGLADLKTHIAARADVFGQEPEAGPDCALSDIRFLPTIPNPSKILCVAINYREDGDELGSRPEYPLLFTRFASSQTGHNELLPKPSHSEMFDYEGELAVIIGRPGHRIAEADALGHVAGYACFNDGSVRDWQKHSSQFTPGKNFARTAGFGPWMVSANECVDPHSLNLETRVNGEVRQRTSTSRMIFSISWLISYISQFAPLVPGDVIVTGTPKGFGSSLNPPVFLKVGDLIEVEITGLGILSNVVGNDE
ncbi:fumarylacetoacetate hydrolase family protein [Agrobacterium arsenijevicii]|uniref:fumarylacetoacetate hydrolase family protein n=1 Tax=Agrobacterium arsenijevicii TaxID=1585697 RepID=UPI0026D0E3F9